MNKHKAPGNQPEEINYKGYKINIQIDGSYAIHHNGAFMGTTATKWGAKRFIDKHLKTR